MAGVLFDAAGFAGLAVVTCAMVALAMVLTEVWLVKHSRPIGGDQA